MSKRKWIIIIVLFCVLSIDCTIREPSGEIFFQYRSPIGHVARRVHHYRMHGHFDGDCPGAED